MFLLSWLVVAVIGGDGRVAPAFVYVVVVDMSVFAPVMRATRRMSPI